MFRRGFLKTAASSSALLACKPSSLEASPAPVPVSAKWIDVHCHVFNGRDLPIYEFVKKTRLGHPGAGDWFAAALVAFLAGGLHRKAPSPADEIAFLEASSPLMAAEAQAAADPVVGLMRLRARVDMAQITAAVREGRPRQLQDHPASGDMAGAPRDVNALRMLDKALRVTRIRKAASAASSLPPPPSDRELERFGALIQISRENADSAKAPTPALPGVGSAPPPGIGAIIGRFFNWGLLFASTRDSLVSNLAALYPSNATLMLTPALVDYDAWLGSPDTHPADQLRVMERIAIMRAKQGMPVHTFAAFDPWRCLRIRSAGVDILAELIDALKRGSAIGVKLYPPMGFAAADNAGRDTAAHPFPAELAKLTKGRAGLELDAVLDELFDYCAANGIPVMAHCGPSNASAPGYADLAAPAYWRKALIKARPHRAELRLNLAHFGGIWGLGEHDLVQRRWAQEIASLMRDYPNVYSDIGYFGSVLHPEESNVLDATVEFITGEANGPRSVLRSRLMYGSDWSMIGPEPSSSSYAARAVEALSPVWPGEQQEDLTWRNAARFLGLGPNDQTRERLLKFYAASGIDSSSLLNFDPET